MTNDQVRLAPERVQDASQLYSNVTRTDDGDALWLLHQVKESIRVDTKPRAGMSLSLGTVGSPPTAIQTCFAFKVYEPSGFVISTVPGRRETRDAAVLLDVVVNEILVINSRSVCVCTHRAAS